MFQRLIPLRNEQECCGDRYLQSSKTESSSESPHPHEEASVEYGATTSAKEDPPAKR